VSRIDGVLYRLSTFMAVLSALFIMIIMSVMSVDVGSRALRDDSISGVYELTQTLLVFIVFLALAKAERDGVHVRVELVTSRLPAPWREAARRLSTLASALIVVLMAYAACLRALDSIEIAEFTQGAVAFPVWPARAVLALGLIVLAAEIVIRGFRALPKSAEPPGAQVRQTRDRIA
jgi:TRAP-type C4-dicarboxylate transport system permease small subunit